MALTPKNIEDICGKIANGQSLRAICRELGIAEATARYALKRTPEAFAQFARARELGFDALAEECLEISDMKELDPADRRVRIETRLKLLGKWSQRYGDKVDHTLTGPDGGPVQIAHASVTDLARAVREIAAGRAQPIALTPEPKQIERKGDDLL